jgi:hypothetical protein
MLPAMDSDTQRGSHNANIATLYNPRWKLIEGPVSGSGCEVFDVCEYDSGQIIANFGSVYEQLWEPYIAFLTTAEKESAG